MLAVFAALKDLDQVIVVDDDIDPHDPVEVEYAVATRVEASRDLILIPGARGHEYVRVSDRGMRTKLGIDATVPFAERARLRRGAPFAPFRLGPGDAADRDPPWFGSPRDPGAAYGGSGDDVRGDLSQQPPTSHAVSPRPAPAPSTRWRAAAR